MKIESIFGENEGKNLENYIDKFTQNPNKITMIKSTYWLIQKENFENPYKWLIKCINLNNVHCSSTQINENFQ